MVFNNLSKIKTFYVDKKAIYFFIKMLAFNFYYDMSHKMGVNTNQISENATNVDIWFEQLKRK